MDAEPSGVEWSSYRRRRRARRRPDQRARGLPPLACLSGAHGWPTQRGDRWQGRWVEQMEREKAVDLLLRRTEPPLGLCVFLEQAVQGFWALAFGGASLGGSHHLEASVPSCGWWLCSISECHEDQ
jgi:hypothetical protein